MADKLFAEWFWIDRWVGSSAFALKLEARGLYREMMTQAWRRGAQLPNDPDQIRRMCAVTVPEWRRTWPLVRRYWEVRGLTLVNATQVEVYADAKARADNAQQKAQKGALSRWAGNAQAHAHASDQALPKHMPKQMPEHMPEHMPEQPVPGEAPQDGANVDAQALREHCPLSLSLSQEEDRTPRTPHSRAASRGTRLTRQERAEAERIRNNRFGCTHTPRCDSVGACIEAIALERRP